MPNPSSMDIPWSRIAMNRAHPSMVLADPKLDETAGEKFSLFSIRRKPTRCLKDRDTLSRRLPIWGKTASRCLISNFPCQSRRQRRWM